VTLQRAEERLDLYRMAGVTLAIGTMRGLSVTQAVGNHAFASIA
jgi:hypothetical protein